MRRLAFILTILGLFILVLLLNLSPKEISTQKELESLEINTKVSLTGKIIEERIIYQNTKLLTLDNEIQLVYECPQTLKDTKISILGIVSEYNGEKQVTVLRRI